MVPRINTQKAKPMNNTSTELEKLRIQNDLEHSHLSEKIDGLKDSIKDNREFFTTALSSLDKKVWTLVVLTMSTLLTTVIAMVL